MLKLLTDTVSDQLLQSDIITHLKQILTSSDTLTQLLYNSLMLIKSLCTIGQYVSGHQTL